MKEFDKWDEVSCVDKDCIARNLDCNECSGLKKLGWKAALIWAQSHKSYDIKDMIYEELES